MAHSQPGSLLYKARCPATWKNYGYEASSQTWENYGNHWFSFHCLESRIKKNYGNKTYDLYGKEMKSKALMKSFILSITHLRKLNNSIQS